MACLRSLEFKAFIIVLLAGFLLYGVNVAEVKAQTTTILTRTFYSGSQDGYMSVLDLVYGTARNQSYADFSYPSSNTTAVGQEKHPTNEFSIYRSYLYFDTRILPSTVTNTTITEATLSLYEFNDQSTTDFNITIQNGQPQWPRDPFQIGDYFYYIYTGNGGSLNTSTLTSGRFNITLNGNGESWIQHDAITKLCLKSSRDINNIEPATTDNEWIEVYAAEAGITYSPRLYVTYNSTLYTFNVYGAYDETGVRDGAINCTFYRGTEAPFTFELDGSEVLEAETTENNVLHFDIGYNESRIYYVYGTYEDIYVVNPTDPYAPYYFSINDFAGVSWGYLESMMNINGSNTVIERQTVEIVNNIPFMWSWGVSYTMRVVCNLGEYTYGSYVAGETAYFNLAITRDMFPVNYTDIGDITVSATRMNDTHIRAVYVDAAAETDWVNFDFHEYGNSTAFHSYNTTSNSVTYNWYDGYSTMNYVVIVTINHANFGTRYWTFTCPVYRTIPTNPWSGLDLLGDFVFDANQIPAALILVSVCFMFSWYNAPVGIIATLLVAAVLVWLGWFSASWAWITTSGAICFIIVLAMFKERMRV